MDFFEGTYAEEEICVAQLAIPESKEMPDAHGLTGTVFTLTVERYHRHPELKGERLLCDSEKSPQLLNHVTTRT
jgi:hypothetical protein